MDTVSKIERSRIMSLIKNKNTKPELIFRNILWKNGLKGYRINYKKIFGRPDIYFSKFKTAIFIDGCFWHGCENCYRKPQTNKRYWSMKIKDNQTRDNNINNILEKQNVNVLRIWEHEFENGSKFSKQIDNIIEYIIANK